MEFWVYLIAVGGSFGEFEINRLKLHRKTVGLKKTSIVYKNMNLEMTMLFFTKVTH